MIEKKEFYDNQIQAMKEKKNTIDAQIKELKRYLDEGIEKLMKQNERVFHEIEINLK